MRPGVAIAVIVVAAAIAVVVSNARSWLGRADRPARPVLVGGASEPGRLAPRARASSSLAEHPPELVMDGRRRGHLPHAWRPAPGAPAELVIEWQEAVDLAGMTLWWQHPPDKVELSGDGESISISPPAGELVRTVWFASSWHTRRITLRFIPSAGTAIVELVPILHDTDIWLLGSSSRGDWEAEILTAGGLPVLGRAEISDSEQPGASDALQLIIERARTIIVCNMEIGARARARLREFVSRGGTLIELGPVPAVFGQPPAPLAGDPGPGSNAPPIRWPKSMAPATPLSSKQRTGSGVAIRWNGDLAEAVRRLRQGAPELVPSDSAGSGEIRPADLFAGELERADHDRPDADLLVRMLITQIASAPGTDILIAPLPHAHSSLLVFTADQDFFPDIGVLAQSEALASVGMSALLTAADIGARADVEYPDSPGTLLAPAAARSLARRGHEIGIHPNLVGLAPAAMSAAIRDHVQAFTRAFGQAPVLVRNHHLRWHGYVDMARFQAAAGLRMNLDYMSLAVRDHGDLGFMSACGLPMRFADHDGSVLPILHQPTHLDDHVLLPARFGYQPYDLDGLIDRSRTVIDLAQHYGVPVVVNHHPYFWSASQGAWQSALLAHARARDIPVWGAGRWLDFVEQQRQAVLRKQGPRRWMVAGPSGLTLLIESAPGAAAPRLDGRIPATIDEVTLGDLRFRRLVIPDGVHDIEL